MSVPRSFTPSSVLALAALLCLMVAAPTTGALAQTPDPAPLWKAYPLTPSKTTGAKPTERPNGAPLIVDETPPSRTSGDGAAPRRASVPLAATVAFYLVLAA